MCGRRSGSSNSGFSMCNATAWVRLNEDLLLVVMQLYWGRQLLPTVADVEARIRVCVAVKLVPACSREQCRWH